jgi:hypothetical protein
MDPGRNDQPPNTGEERLQRCDRVLYGVPDPAPFIEELTRHARRRIVAIWWPGSPHR